MPHEPVRGVPKGLRTVTAAQLEQRLQERGRSALPLFPQDEGQLAATTRDLALNGGPSPPMARQ